MNLRATGTVSLALNFLLGAVVIGLLRFQPVPVPSPLRIIRSAPTPSREASRVVRTNVVEGAAFQWRDLESEDYRAYVANLRAVGCPEPTIRQIIEADIHALYASREAALAREDRFWLTGVRKNAREKEDSAHRDAWAAEKRALLQDILGSPIDMLEARRELGRSAEIELLVGFLTENQLMRVFDSVERTQEEARRFRDAREQILLPEDVEFLKTKVAALKADLAAVLSPQELEELTLRVSDLEHNLFRSTRPGLEAITGPEYREMVRIQARGTDVFARLIDVETDDTSDTVEAERQRQLEKLLGSQRLAAYERANDDRFQKLDEIARQFELPAQTAMRAYELRKGAEREWNQIGAGEDLSEEDLATRRLEVATETRRALGQILRGQALEEYLKRDPFWFRMARDTETAGKGVE